MRTRGRAFTLLELMVSLAIIAVLISLLLPMLVQARRHAARTLCMNNVRQIGIGWQSFLGDEGTFPGAEVEPQWRYAGVRFLGGSVERPVADASRPLTEYLHSSESTTAGTVAASLYRCPEDSGLATIGTPDHPSASVLQGKTCYQEFGNSYRANEWLLNASLSGIDKSPRPLRDAEVSTPPSRLILFGDPVWYYASRDVQLGEQLDASWHSGTNAGHIVTLDGSVRHVSFVGGSLGDFTTAPR